VSRHATTLTGFVVAGMLIGCSGAAPGGGGGGGAGVASPVTSLSPQLQSSLAALRAALEPQGFRIDPAGRPYRPGEPGELIGVPRAVLRVDLADPDEGYVVVYDFADPAAAAAGGRRMAEFLGGGPAQADYPPDARFSLSQLAGTLIFAWWSPERSSDRQRADAAFRALGSVGQPIPVLR
jgi:hypothetical protein